MVIPYRLQLVALTLGITLAAQTASAQPDFTRKERKPCANCHEGAWTSGKLTEAGAFYSKARTLKGFVPKTQSSHGQGDEKKPVVKS